MERNKISNLKFKLPRFQEISDMGLFLDQATKYINNNLSQLDDDLKLTPAMISNYVKMKIIYNTTGKTYNREQIAYLIFIAIMKNAIPLTDIANMFKLLEKEEYSIEIAYNYFCDEFENVLEFVFENKDNLDYIGGKLTKSKLLLKNAILAIVYKIFVKKQLNLLSTDKQKTL